MAYRLSYFSLTILTQEKYIEPSSFKRYIMRSSECEQPFIKDSIEFAVIKVKGQSFIKNGLPYPLV